MVFQDGQTQAVRLPGTLTTENKNRFVVVMGGNNSVGNPTRESQPALVANDFMNEQKQLSLLRQLYAAPTIMSLTKMMMVFSHAVNVMDTTLAGILDVQLS